MGRYRENTTIKEMLNCRKRLGYSFTQAKKQEVSKCVERVKSQKKKKKYSENFNSIRFSLKLISCQSRKTFSVFGFREFASRLVDRCAQYFFVFYLFSFFFYAFSLSLVFLASAILKNSIEIVWQRTEIHAFYQINN